MQQEEQLIQLLSQIKQYEQGQIPKELQQKIHLISESVKKNTTNVKVTLGNIQSYSLFDIAEFLTLNELVKLKSINKSLRSKMFLFLNRKLQNLQSQLRKLEEELQTSTESPNQEEIQKKLNESMPILQQALQAMNVLTKNSITELKSFKNPPNIVAVVMEAVCILFNVKPD